MSKVRQGQVQVVETDTHKAVLDQRENRKIKGRRKHNGKAKQNTKWFDRWD